MERQQYKLLTKLSGNLDHLDHCTDCTCLTGVLVADDCFGNALGLNLGSAELLQLGQSEEAALELERHMRVRHVLIGRANVVKEACQCPGFEEGTRMVFWEVMLDDVGTCHTVSAVLENS